MHYLLFKLISSSSRVVVPKSHLIYSVLVLLSLKPLDSKSPAITPVSDSLLSDFHQLALHHPRTVIWKKNEKNKYAIRKYKWECWKMSMLIKWEQKSVQESHLQFYNVLTFIFGFSWLHELNKSLMDVICPSFVEASNSFQIDDLLIFLDFPVRLHIKVSSDRIFLKIWGCRDTEVFNNRNIQIYTEKTVSKSKLI